MKKSILKDRSFEFGLLIVSLAKDLRSNKKEYIISKQILRSGTAIGALIREAEYGQSRADFISKMNIALKEANETEYWLDLLKGSEYLGETEYQLISARIKELLRMLISTIKTAKANQ